MVNCYLSPATTLTTVSGHSRFTFACLWLASDSQLEAMAVREWFAGREILLTGVTSDIGNAVLNKLLRSCPEIKTIHVILRSKNGLSNEDRIKKIIESPGFERVRQECPNAMSCINVMEGNLVYTDLALSQSQVAVLNNVSVVIHAGGPHDAVLELCCELPALRGAAVAESIFKHRGRITESSGHENMPEIPLAMIRIPAIGPALKEPMPGNINVVKGATALMIGAGFALGNSDLPAAIVPVDLVANTIIASVWDIGASGKRKVTIYNVPALNCTWGDVIRSGSRASKKFPYPSFGIRGMTSSPWLHWLVVLLLEWLPSVLCDAFLYIVRGKPSVGDTQQRIRTTLNTLDPILSRSWIGDEHNVNELNNRLSPGDREEFLIRTEIDPEIYVLCAAAAVKRLCVDEDHEKIITNFKRVLAIIVVVIIFFSFFR